MRCKERSFEDETILIVTMISLLEEKDVSGPGPRGKSLFSAGFRELT
jgi:hypothetical protein